MKISWRCDNQLYCV